MSYVACCTTALLLVFAASSMLPPHSAAQASCAIKDDLLHKMSGRSAAPAAVHLQRKAGFVWKDDSWFPTAVTEYSYSEIGRAETRHYEHNGVEIAPWYLETTEVTVSGSVETTRKVHDTGAWIPDVRFTTDFLSDPATGESYVSRRSRWGWHVTQWIEAERRTYSYTPSLDLEGGQTESWRHDNSWGPTYRFTVEQIGSDVVIVDQVRQAENWANVKHTTFRNWTVKALQRRLAQIENEVNDFDGALYCIFLLPMSEVSAWTGTEWHDVWRQGAEFDDRTGDMIAFFTESQVDGAWIATERFSLDYAAAGRVSSIRKDVSDGHAWMSVARESYLRDQFGRISDVALQWPNSSGELENARRFTFEWNHLGTASERSEHPAKFSLGPAYPNPFNPVTRLSYELTAASRVAVNVYDTSGRLVVTLIDGMRPAGSHEVVFDAAELRSGTYIVRLKTAESATSRFVTLVR